jgi:hypothetical protein
MKAGESTLWKGDCIVLTKLMGETVLELTRYLADGCPTAGLNDAFNARVSLIGLRNRIIAAFEKPKRES